MLTYNYEEKAVRLDHFMEDARGKALDRPTRLRLVRQLAEVLRYAHARRLVHRALAPQNILVSLEQGAPLLKVMNWHTGRGIEQTTGTAHLGDMVANESTAYMAPETFSAPQLADVACDVFSLGCVAYLLLTGQPPAADQLGLATRLKEHQGLLLDAVLDGTPAALASLVRKATHPDVSQRHESVDTFLRELDKVEKEARSWEESDHTVDPFEAAPEDRLHGDWLLVRRLGQGAISTAFLVRHEGTGELLVLKLPTNPTQNERLELEAETLSRLDHRRIVKLRELLWVGTRRGLLLTSAGEETLADRLAKEGSLGLELLQRFGEDLLEAAEYLEDQGIAHRDLKPANLGVRKVGKDEALHLTLFDFSLTRERPDNLRIGTPGYRDPFLSKTRPWDGAAERYSLAATLYEMATGTLPQWGDGRSDPALVACELQVDEERFARGLEAGFSRFFRRALHREARERYPSVEAMRSAWGKLFTTQRVELQPAPITLPEQVTGTLDLLETTQDPKLLQVFERLEVRTVEQLVACPRSRIRMLKGLGSQTRKDLLEHQMLLESKLERPVEPVSGASLESLVEALVPKEKADRAFSIQYLGPAGGSSWPTGSEAAQGAQLAKSESYKLLPRLRKRWDKLDVLRTVCDELVAALGSSGARLNPQNWLRCCWDRAAAFPTTPGPGSAWAKPSCGRLWKSSRCSRWHGWTSTGWASGCWWRRAQRCIPTSPRWQRPPTGSSCRSRSPRAREWPRSSWGSFPAKWLGGGARAVSLPWRRGSAARWPCRAAGSPILRGWPRTEPCSCAPGSWPAGRCCGQGTSPRCCAAGFHWPGRCRRGRPS